MVPVTLHYAKFVWVLLLIIYRVHDVLKRHAQLERYKSGVESKLTSLLFFFSRFLKAATPQITSINNHVSHSVNGCLKSCIVVKVRGGEFGLKGCPTLTCRMRGRNWSINITKHPCLTPKPGTDTNTKKKAFYFATEAL